MELETSPQPTLESATRPTMPTVLGPLGRSKQTCRGEMEKHTRWSEVFGGKSKNLGIGSKNLFCIILEMKVVPAYIMRCLYSHVRACACTHTPTHSPQNPLTQIGDDSHQVLMHLRVLGELPLTCWRRFPDSCPLSSGQSNFFGILLSSIRLT